MATDEPVTVRHMSIGEFARRTRLPVSTLRYYHELGVLMPADVDATTGYRYYSDGQIDVAIMVATLRQLGVAPNALAQLSDGSQTTQQVLSWHRDRLQLEVEERSTAIARIEALLAQPDVTSHAHVTVVQRSERRVPAICGPIAFEGAAGAIRRLAVRLRSRLRAAGHEDPTWYAAMMPLDLDVDPFPTTVYVDRELADPGLLHSVLIPGGDYATITHTAPAVWLSSSYRDLLDWVGAQDLIPAASVIEEYKPDGAINIAVALKSIES